MGGMNQDDSDRIIPQNDYRLALNVSNSIKEDNDFGEVTNIKGARLIDNPNFDTNANAQVIGSWEDELEKKVYYFVHNVEFSSSGQIQIKHAIYYYDINTDSVKLVLKSRKLNFNKAHTINHIGKIGNYLCWTDGVNSPKKLDIVKAENGDYDNYTDDYFLEFYSKPPMDVIIATSKTNEQQKTNNVKGKLWQWKYRWIYYDDTKSTFSPISKIYAPANQYVGSFIAEVPYYTDNYYELKFNTGDLEVFYVEIAAREGNDGDFYSVVQINVEGLENQIQTFDFYNDNQSLPIPREESNQLYSFVPLVASALEIIQPNRLLLGDYVEGYDNIDIITSVELEEGDDITLPSVGFCVSIERRVGVDVVLSKQPIPQPPFNSGTIPLPDINLLCGRGYISDLTEDYRTQSGSRGLMWETENGLYDGTNSSRFKEAYRDSKVILEIEKDPIIDDEGLSYVFGLDWTMAYHENYDDTDEDDCGGGGVYGWGTWMLSDEETNKTKVFSLEGGITAITGDDSVDISLRIFTEMVRVFKQNYSQYWTIISDNSDFFEAKFNEDFIGQVDTIRGGYPRQSGRSGCDRSWNNNFKDFTITIFRSQNIDANGTYLGDKIEVFLQGAEIGNWDWYSGNNADRETAQNTLFNQRYPLTWNFVPFISSVAYTLKGNYATTNKFKRGSRHQLGLVYYDEAGRSSLTQTDESLNFYIPTQNENKNEIEVKLNIFHNPPKWAKTWQVVYSGNLNYQKFIYTNIDQFETNGELWSCVLVPLKLYQEESGSILSYDWTEGDIIRFVSPAYSLSENQDYYDDVYQSLIVKAEDYVEDGGDGSKDGYKVYFKPIVGFQDASKDGEILPLVEIYTPKIKQQTNDGNNLSANIFYEVGEVFPVVQDRHLPNGETQISLNSTGDIYRRYRQDNVARMIGFVEDMNYTDFKRNPYWDKGRINISDPSFKQVRRTNALTWSGVFTTNATINETNIFKETNFIEYETIYGSIKKLFYNDGTLLIIMSNKLGSALINKNVLFDGSGQSVGSVGQQEQVVGNINYYVGDYGIGDFVESFSHFGNIRFFFDSYHTTPMVLYSNGLEPIDTKMNTYFTKKTNELIYQQTERNHSVKSAFNRDTGEFFMIFFKKIYNESSFFGWNNNANVRTDLSLNGSIVKPEKRDVDSTDVPYTTLSYSSVKKRWSSFYSFSPEWIDQAENAIVTFVDGEIYVHDNLQRNVFYTQDISPSKLEVIFNAESDNTKVFKNFGVKSSKLWLSEKSTTPEGQETSNIQSDYREREGEYYASLMRDENSPKGIIEGDRMRSFSMKTIFVNVSSELSKLWSVSCEYFVSKFTK